MIGHRAMARSGELLREVQTPRGIAGLPARELPALGIVIFLKKEGNSFSFPKGRALCFLEKRKAAVIRFLLSCPFVYFNP